jgi:hypothetical protein
MWLPGYTGLRVPSRFAMLGELCLAISASVALVHLARRTWWRIALASLAVVGIVSDGFMEPLPIATPPQRLVLDGTTDARVIEIPVDDPRVSVAAMYRAMYHGRPLINGYTGYLPPHYAILSLGLWRGDTSVLSFFARDKPLVIVVNADADADGGFRKMIADIPGIEPRGITGAGTVFLLPQQPRPPSTPEGSLLPASVSDAGNRRVVADLGAVRAITGIEFALRGYYKDLDGRVLVEVSEDGQQWHEAWLGWTGEHALEAALRDPQRTRVRIPIAPSLGRFLRLYPADPWLVPELGVVGR